MKTGVVILNYKTAKNTCALAQLLEGYKCVDSIVIVDNCSPNNSAEIIEKFVKGKASCKIIYLKSEDNIGYARGNNIGLHTLVQDKKMDICFVMNPDVSIEESELQKIINAFSEYKEYGVITSGRVYNNRKPIRQYWDLPTYSQLMMECLYFYRTFVKKHLIYHTESSNSIKEIGAAPGSLFGIRSDLLEEIGYLDEGTFLYFEENCLSKKVLTAGYKVGILTNAIYTVKAGEASTIAVKRTGSGMKYYVESERFYVRNYLCKDNLLKSKLFDVCSGYMLMQGYGKAKLLNLIAAVKGAR